ncbi:MAG: hypothetical protein FWD88_05575 [Treponema sp.]|nr:hypothetical protein [Treponema sp.]
MTDLIQHIGSAITMTGGLIEIFRKADNAQFIKHVSDLTVQLATVQNDVVRLMDENRELKAKIEEMETNPLQYDGYIYRDGHGHAFCPGCYDDKRKRIHLRKTTAAFIDLYTVWGCPVCDKKYSYRDG